MDKLNLDDYDVITECCTELNGLASVMYTLSEKEALLQTDAIEFFASSIERISKDIYITVNKLHGDR